MSPASGSGVVLGPVAGGAYIALFAMCAIRSCRMASCLASSITMASIIFTF